MTGVTEEGRQAYQILTWANEDQAGRVSEAVRRVDELAHRLMLRPGSDGTALAEVRDVGGVLARLEDGLGASLAGGDDFEDDELDLDLDWMDAFLDMAVPESVSEHLGLLSVQAEAATETISGQLEMASANGHHIPGTDYTYFHGWRRRNGGGTLLISKYPAWRVAQEKQGKKPQSLGHAERAHVTKDPRSKSAVQKSIARHQAKVAAAKPEQGRVPQAAPTPPPPAEPGSTGEAMTREDPALASLAAPGTSMAALKAYIDARVAAEVARQVGSITDKQHAELQDGLSRMHRSQQRLISLVRKQWDEKNSEHGKTVRTKLAMNSLFATAGAAVGVAGLAMDVNPLLAAASLGIVPLVNVIHDWVRGFG